MELSVNDAAEFFGVSKEAIHNRIRRGSLEAVLRDGVKMVIVDEKTAPKKSTQTPQRAPRAKTPVHDERYYKLLEEQNAKLQERVERLESETRLLRDQKEQMLIAEREKIEAIYKEKDEQLKNVLSTLSQQFMLTLSKDEPAESLETVDVEIDEVQEETPQQESIKVSDANIISLKKYIKTLNVSEKKAKKIKQRFTKRAQKDRRLITLGEKIYLDLLRYDYSDLL